jgi:hypothetical protein
MMLLLLLLLLLALVRKGEGKDRHGEDGRMTRQRSLCVMWGGRGDDWCRRCVVCRSVCVCMYGLFARESAR